MPDLMEVDSDSLEEDRSLNDQTLESGMIMYHDLGIGDVISPEEYLWRIRRSQICISNGERKDDLETSNQEMPILNNDFKNQISNEDLELIHKGLVLLHVRSKANDAIEITNLLIKIAEWNEKNMNFYKTNN